MTKQNAVALASAGRIVLAAGLLTMVTDSVLAAGAPRTSAAQANGQTTLVGPSKPDRVITLALSLPSRDPEGAQAHVTTLGDPLYRHYLTPSAYEARFGASSEDYEFVVAWARRQGFSIGERYVGRTILPVTASVSAAEAALGVRFSDFQDGAGRVFRSADREPTLPAIAGGRLAGIMGLTSSTHYVPQLIALPAGMHAEGNGRGPNGAFSAADLRSIYSVPVQSFSVKTQTVAVFEQGGFDPDDITTYLKRNNLPAVPVRARSVDHSGKGIDDPSVELEAVLDVDMIIGINPAVKQVLVYEDGSDSFQVALVDSLSAMATDDLAKTISISYANDEDLQGRSAIEAENTVLTQLAAQGQAVFASSGDLGAYGEGGKLRLNVSDPASQPLVTSVGGTTLFVGTKETYNVENVWEELLTFIGATGGGISHVWPIPSYQLQGGYSVAQLNGGSSVRRNVPDVASVGNPLTGVAVYSKLNGGWMTEGGTSVSAPIWAGFYSLVNATSEGLGHGVASFANPSIYQIGGGIQQFFPDYNDVFDGTNGNRTEYGYPGFNAGYEYDNTTGWGSFNASNLLAELALLPTNVSIDLPPNARDLSVTLAKTTATLKWLGSPVDKGYIVMLTNYNTRAVISTLVTGKRTVSVTSLVPKSTYCFQVISLAIAGRSAPRPTSSLFLPNQVEDPRRRIRYG